MKRILFSLLSLVLFSPNIVKAQVGTLTTGGTDACVEGKTYAIVVSSTYSGTFSAVVYFSQLNSSGIGTWALVAEDGSPGAGTYVAGANSSSILAAGTDGGYVGAFGATCSGSGSIQNLSGAGFGSVGDFFLFTGATVSNPAPTPTPTSTPTPNPTNPPIGQCNDGKDNDSDGKIDALSEGSLGSGDTFTFPSRDAIKNFIYSTGVPIQRLTSDGGDSPYPFAGTLERVCQLKGYQDVVFWTPLSTGGNFGVCYTSPGNNSILIANQLTSGFTAVDADAVGNICADVLICGNKVVECSDGVDNDSDGKTDYPVDSGCASAQDRSEKPHDPKCKTPSSPTEFEQCRDSIDNDGDSLKDFPADPGCTSLDDDSEENGSTCTDVQMKVDFTDVANAGSGNAEAILYLDNRKIAVKSGEWFSLVNSGVSIVDGSFTIGSNQHSGMMGQRLGNGKIALALVGNLTIGAERTEATISIKNGSFKSLDFGAYQSSEFESPTNGSYSNSLYILPGIDDEVTLSNAKSISLKSVVSNDSDPFTINYTVDNTCPIQCADSIDNDGDAAIDFPADFSCSSAQDNDEANPKAQCQDGADNDTDGAIDHPADFSCSSKQDNDETNPKAQCQDGLDNDSDGAIDLADPSCSSKQDNDEADPKAQCQDVIDNDSDGAIDFPTDFSCSSPTDNDETNPKAQCQDGLDNDRDVLVDLNDPGCTTKQDNNEGDATSQCQDKLDNDSDGATDYPVDFSCYEAIDNDEANPKSQCQDGIDNDSDGLIDLNDPGCSSKQDSTENDGTTQCQDKLDNDSDGAIDYPADYSCSATTDNDETNPKSQCQDGIDNDNDGLIDLADPGCTNKQDNSESTATSQCQDTTDNDNDGATDYPGDFSCSSASDNDETNPKAQCQDGLDNDGDGKIDNKDLGCTGTQDNSEADPASPCSGAQTIGFGEYISPVATPLPTQTGIPTGISVTTQYANRGVLFSVENRPAGQYSVVTTNYSFGGVSGASGFPVLAINTLPSGATPNAILTIRFVNPSNSSHAAPVSGSTISLNVDDTDVGTYPILTSYDVNGALIETIAVATRNQRVQFTKGSVARIEVLDNKGDGHTIDDLSYGALNCNYKFACEDGLDNDNDGAIDYPADFSCSSAIDNDEANPKSQCQDGVDNDSDGLIDLADPGCANGQDNSENTSTSQCQDTIDNDSDGAIDYPADFSCTSASDNDETNPKSQCQDGIDNDSDGLIDLADPGCANKQDNSEGSATTQCQDGMDNDSDSATDYPADFSCSSASDNDEANPKSQCQDGVDNDSDGLVDLADPGCSNGQDNSENTSTSQCQDGIDNDSDGATDYPADFSCSSTTDNDESDPKSQCQDGIDNDNDGVTDSADPGCSNGQDNTEDTKTTQCQDTTDNDSDGAIDYPADFGCSAKTDNDESNPQSQCQDGIDNDNDGATDLADFSCSNNQDNDESGPKSQCQDGIDNDGDGFTDSADVSCSNPQDNDEGDGTKAILPSVDCVSDNSDGTFTAYFGYENLNAAQVLINPSNSATTGANYFTPGPIDRGQSRTFNKGKVAGAFNVVFDGSELTWIVQPAGANPASATASSNSPRCVPLVPRAECIELGSTGQLQATFGYTNSNAFALTIPVGSSNGFTPTPADRGQPTKFLTGQVNSVFKVNFPDTGSIQWLLNGRSAVASAALPFCLGSEGCTLTPVVNTKSTLDDLAIELASVTKTVADRLVKISEQQPQVIRDAKRAKKAAAKFLDEANVLVFKMPDVIKSCPNAPEYCAQVDNQPTIDGLGSLYRRQWSQIKRIVARSQFRSASATRNRDKLFLKTRSSYKAGLETLKTVPRFATECE